MVYLKLNVGCGTDTWGDVRLDNSRVYHGKQVKLTILADAQNLPFKDKCFGKTKAHHILEHLPDWKKALKEWCRVTNKQIELVVPTDAGYVNKQIYMEILSFLFDHLIRLPTRRREHLWKFNPAVIEGELRKHGFNSRVYVVRRPLIGILSYRRKDAPFPFTGINQRLSIACTYKIIAHAS